MALPEAENANRLAKKANQDNTHTDCTVWTAAIRQMVYKKTEQMEKTFHSRAVAYVLTESMGIKR